MTKFFDCSKLKEFADDDSKFDGIGRKFLRLVVNTVGKGEIFPTVFSKDMYYRNVKTRACLGKVLRDFEITQFIQGHENTG